jgi:hypothetical protein
VLFFFGADLSKALRDEENLMAELRPSNMTDRIAAMQDFKLYRELHW